MFFFCLFNPITNIKRRRELDLSHRNMELRSKQLNSIIKLLSESCLFIFDKRLKTLWIFKTEIKRQRETLHGTGKPQEPPAADDALLGDLQPSG